MSALEKRLIWCLENQKPEIALYVCEICALSVGGFKENVWPLSFTRSIDEYADFWGLKTKKELAEDLVKDIQSNAYPIQIVNGASYDVNFSGYEHNYKMSKAIPWLIRQVREAFKNKPSVKGEFYKYRKKQYQNSFKHRAIKKHWPLPYFRHIANHFENIALTKNLREDDFLDDAIKKAQESINASTVKNCVWSEGEWYAVRLKGLKDIREEGRIQSHCLKHAYYNSAGYYSIRKGNKRYLTVSIRNNCVNQALGKANRDVLQRSRSQKLYFDMTDYRIKSLNANYEALRKLQNYSSSKEARDLAFDLFYSTVQHHLRTGNGWATHYDNFASLKKAIDQSFKAESGEEDKLRVAYLSFIKEMKYTDDYLSPSKQGKKSFKGLKFLEDIYDNTFEK